MSDGNSASIFIFVGGIVVVILLVRVYQRFRFPPMIDEDMESLGLDEMKYEKTSEKNTAAGDYDCPGCGAALDGDSDVSPSGDVKCRYCKRWFNVHRN